MKEKCTCLEHVRMLIYCFMQFYTGTGGLASHEIHTDFKENKEYYMKVLKAIRDFIRRIISVCIRILALLTWPVRKSAAFFIRLSWRYLYRFKVFVLGIAMGFVIVFASRAGLDYTGTNDFCDACHIHPHVVYSWKKSTHFKNKSGVVVNCVECHLPPGGFAYLKEKTRLGVRDVYGMYFKDKESFDWDSKSMLEHAVTYTYDSSCLNCHSDLYSLGLSPKGVEAHEYYMKNTGKLRCINCHITVGHYHEEPVEEVDYLAKVTIEIPSYPPDTGEFAHYTEELLDTGVTFNMIAVPGGTFMMGGADKDKYRGEDEGTGPVEVTLSPFWMGEIEVSWREYDVFYAMTSDRGKDENAGGDTVTETASYETPDAVDAVTGPTPPYGSPDQGWGKGLRPAITMTHHAAMKYCEWLSQVTGKKYRLPTEAEWEYACRAGTTGPYFFEGAPGDLTHRSLKNRLFGVDTSEIDQYVWYEGTSKNKTQLPYVNKPNPWGFYNMLGNVAEFCLDWYSPEAYLNYRGKTTDPRGPSSGKERVVRGGSYTSDPAELRTAARGHTLHDRWLMTDPQSPKSIWWYSDTKEVGFRVVRELDTAAPQGQ